MGRWQAFLVHLSISLTVFGAIAYCVIALWYPDFLFTTDGGLQGLKLLLGVDLVVGPLLTLIVYRAGKPGLRTDLTIIGTVQAACLAAGVWVVHAERTLAIVYVDGSFYSVSERSFRDVGVPVPDLDRFPGRSPKWVSVKLPDDYENQSVIRRTMLGQRRMLATLSEYYVPFRPDQVDKREAHPAKEIVDQDRDVGASRPWLQKHGGTLGDYRYYPFGTRYSFGYLAFSAKDGQFVGQLGTPAPRY